MSVKIKSIIKGSPADKCGLKAGDEILKINKKDINDYLDYMYLTANDEMCIELSDRTIQAQNYDFEPFGAEFDTLLIDNPRSCRNKCVFCFIDQLPPNMRQTCYFKDDDYRLSFLQGNYVTLTNMSDSDLDRIIEYNIPRINVSVHTTNPELRCKMLNNKFAGRIMEQMKRFSGSGMQINCQVVLCPGYNDGSELDRTINDILSLGDAVESLSIVPVGISAYRDGLTKLHAFDKESAIKVIEQVSDWQKKIKKARDINFVYLADEFYILAEKDIPSWQEYDGFPQIENGVGLCSSLKSEFDDAIDECKDLNVKTAKSVVTGKLAYSFIKDLVSKIDSNLINVYAINNKFFGESITVSGLVTGGDIISQLKNKQLGELLLIPASMLKHDENVFLDDLTIKDVERELNVKVKVVQNDGIDFLDKLIM
jgi:putative radical SAM enzyme (TIGR03279 family)